MFCRLGSCPFGDKVDDNASVVGVQDHEREIVVLTLRNLADSS